MSKKQPLMAPRTGGLWTDTDLAAFLSVEVSELDAAVAAIPNAPGALTVGWDCRAVR